MRIENILIVPNPCVLYRVSFAKYTVAFFRMSRSYFSILFSRLRRFNTSYSLSFYEDEVILCAFL